MVRIAVGDDESVEPGDARGTQCGIDDAAEVIGRSGVDEPCILRSAQKLGAAFAQIENDEPCRGLKPSGRKTHIGSR